MYVYIAIGIMLYENRGSHISAILHIQLPRRHGVNHDWDSFTNSYSQIVGHEVESRK